MDIEKVRTLLLSMPHTLETSQWGGLVFWVGDKAIGGRMFAHVNLDSTHHHPIVYPAGPERFHELLELEGLIPAPYLARAHWVAAARWSVHRDRDWQTELTAAHALILAKLPAKTLKILSLPKAEQRRLITEARQRQALKEAAKPTPPNPSF